MPSRRSRSQLRADRRRRARYESRGEELPDGLEPAPVAPTDSAAARPSGGLFSRFFPPTPPLPGKGDPLAGFTYTGRARGIVAGAWLLFRHPLVWGAAGVGWAVLQLGLLFIGRQSLIAFAITLGQYVLLIGAGWVGWWRPWLFGLAAGFSGVLFQLLFATILGAQAGFDPTEIATIIGSLTLFAGLYALVGAFAGFYGGYLRRRMATQPAQAKGKRR